MSNNPMSPLKCLVRNGRQAVLPLFLTSFAMNGLALAVPLYSVQVFDRVLHSGSYDTLIVLTVALVAVLATQGWLDAVRSRMMHRIGEWAEEQLLPDASRIVPGPGFERGAVGEVKNLRAFLSGPGAVALIDLPWLPLFTLAAFVLHPAIGWFTVIAAITLFSLTLVNEAVTRRRFESAAAAQGNVMQRLGEFSRKQDAVAGLSMGGAYIAREMAANAAANDEAREVTDIHSNFTSIVKTIRMGAQTLVMAVAAVLVMQHEMSSGGLLAGSILLGRALLPIDGAIAGWKQFQSARESWKRLNAAFAGWSPNRGTTLPAPKGAITVEDATVVVNGNRRLIESVSMQIPAGTCLAIVGPSGSGKSTLCRLLVGAAKPTYGTARIDGAAISDWTEEQRRQYVGYLPQDLSLFAGSVKDNISRFTDADDLDIVNAAALANCDGDLIRSLPGGYDFVLGDGGAPLSGGQRQRLAMARALFGQPKLVVLDEPNSNLDIAGDVALARTIKALKAAGTTVVLVTHRSSLVNEADHIAVMNGGRLVHFGDTTETQAKLNSVVGHMLHNARPEAAQAA
jgi:PrtD family type I secretion system ABC transporter